MKVRFAACLLLAAATAGCGGESSDTSGQVPAGTITIGFPVDLQRDREMANGARIAVRQINGLGGIDGALRIRLLVRDSQREPRRADRLARSLLAEGARVLILPCDVDSARAVVRVAQGRKVLLLGTCNYDPALVDRTPYYWAVGVGANVEAAALADYVENQGFEAVYVTPPDEPEGAQLERYVRAAAAERGIEVLPEPTPKTAIISLRWSRFTAAFAAGLPYTVVGTDLADGPGIRRARGLVFTAFGYPDPGFATDEFYERYRSYYGVRPDSSRSVLAYSAIKLFERAVNKANSAELAAVTHELRGLDWDSPLGHAEYAATGGRNPEMKVTILRVKDGRLELVTRASPGDVPAP